MNKIKKIQFVMIVLALLSSFAYAGSDGRIELGYYFDAPTDEDMTVTVAVSGQSNCMYDARLDTKTKYYIPAGKVGPVWLGASNEESSIKEKYPIYYEAKASSTGGDLCATTQSYFTVNVTSTDSRYSFTTTLGANTGNIFSPDSSKLFILQNGDNQSVCPGVGYCKEQSYWYHYTKTPLLHVIYRPTY